MWGLTGKRAYLYDGEIVDKEWKQKKIFGFTDLIVCLSLKCNKSINLHKLKKFFSFFFSFF